MQSPGDWQSVKSGSGEMRQVPSPTLQPSTVAGSPSSQSAAWEQPTSGMQVTPGPPGAPQIGGTQVPATQSIRSQRSSPGQSRSLSQAMQSGIGVCVHSKPTPPSSSSGTHSSVVQRSKSSQSPSVMQTWQSAERGTLAQPSSSTQASIVQRS